MINNIAFSVFGLNVYWYGISYFLGFLFSYFFILEFGKDFGFKKDFLEDSVLMFIIYSILFARLFHIVFYDPIYYLNHIFEIIRFDHGGMSIHGGILGGLLGLYFQSKKEKVSFLKLLDLFVLPVGLGLAFGRIANFINQELVGKVTNSFFGIIFLKYDKNLRWPVTLFESLKNILVFESLFYLFYIKKLYKKSGLLTGLFLILFNFGRFFIDFLREPEVIVFWNISMGQFLCLIYGFFGIWLLYKIFKN